MTANGANEGNANHQRRSTPGGATGRSQHSGHQGGKTGGKGQGGPGGSGRASNITSKVTSKGMGHTTGKGPVQIGGRTAPKALGQVGGSRKAGGTANGKTGAQNLNRGAGRTSRAKTQALGPSNLETKPNRANKTQGRVKAGMVRPKAATLKKRPKKVTDRNLRKQGTAFQSSTRRDRASRGGKARKNRRALQMDEIRENIAANAGRDGLQEYLLHEEALNQMGLDQAMAGSQGKLMPSISPDFAANIQRVTSQGSMAPGDPLGSGVLEPGAMGADDQDQWNPRAVAGFLEKKEGLRGLHDHGRTSGRSGAHGRGREYLLQGGSGMRGPERDPDRPLKVIPLGGLYEIGKNMTAFECGNDLIVVDVGVAFPENDMPGIDLIIPDFAYIKQHRKKLKAAFFTHGHEDHIGAASWFINEFNCPVYAGPLTIELIKKKLQDKERGAVPAKTRQDYSLNPVQAGDRIWAGSFCVEFIHVNHSIADSFGLFIQSPGGTAYHTGDFRIDFTPPDGKPIDLARIATIGNEGVDLLMAESTNVDAPGFSQSEKNLTSSFQNLFDQAPGRIFIATFSSNVNRLQQIVSIAEKIGRKVILMGRSMYNIFEAASTLGYFHFDPKTLINLEDAKHYDDNQLCFITTGTQGEPMSALNRIAIGTHEQIKIVDTDTIILSSSRIPGNEKAIFNMINHLCMTGANVIYDGLEHVHVSGHAYREELRLLMNLIRPTFFMPVHGEYRHLNRHAHMAEEQGIPKENIFILKNGDTLVLETKLSKGKYSMSGHQIVGPVNEGVIVDGMGIGDVDEYVLQDRRKLADDGIIVISIAVDVRSNKLAAVPVVKAIGVIYESLNDDMVKLCHDRIKSFLNKQNAKEPLYPLLMSGSLQDSIRSLVYDKTHRTPLIMIQAIEV